MIICLGEALFPTGDLEQLQQDFTKYAANFKEFFIATVADGLHANEKHVAHGGRKKTKAKLQHIGVGEIKTLFDHVVMAVDGRNTATDQPSHNKSPMGTAFFGRAAG